MKFSLTTTLLSDSTYSAILYLVNSNETIIGTVDSISGLKSAKKAEDWAATRAQTFKKENIAPTVRDEQHTVTKSFAL